MKAQMGLVNQFGKEMFVFLNFNYYLCVIVGYNGLDFIQSLKRNETLNLVKEGGFLEGALESDPHEKVGILRPYNSFGFEHVLLFPNFGRSQVDLTHETVNFRILSANFSVNIVDI